MDVICGQKKGQKQKKSNVVAKLQKIKATDIVQQIPSIPLNLVDNDDYSEKESIVTSQV